MHAIKFPVTNGSHEIELKILPVEYPLNFSLFCLQKFNISVLVAPTIKKSPLSLVYPIAKTVRFECEFEGMPKPNITWYKNGELLHINGRIKQKVWTLVLSNTVKEDSGIYQVRLCQTKIRDYKITTKN